MTATNRPISTIRSIAKKQKLINSRRKRMVETAIKLCVEKGFDNTTMSEIAEQSRMSKGSLYNYVGSKEDLVFLIQEYVRKDYETKFQDIERNTTGLGWAETLRQYIRTYLETVDRMQDAYNFLNHVVARLDRERRRYLLQGVTLVYEDFEKVLIKGRAAGEFKIDNPKLMAHNIVRLIMAWAHNRWHLRRLFTLEEYLNEQTSLILRALGVDSGLVTTRRIERNV